jgi:N-acetylglucosamine kinase-like BadF-type ATPase
MSRILAVDIGQTGFRLQLASDEVLEGPHGIEALTDPGRITTLAERIAAAVPAGSELSAIGVGLSGFVVGSPAPATLAALLGEQLSAPLVAVAADAVTAYLGTVGDTAGTVVICGTGVAALGADGEGAYRRVDARGYLLGDFGSGFWIGQRGLQAALDAREGRNPGTSLSEAIAELGTPADIYHAAMRSTPAPKYVAAFAVQVIRAAEEGDPVSLRIIDDAADQIALTARTARIGSGPIGLTGGLTRSGIYTDAVARALRRAGSAQPALVIRPDAALEGARLLVERQHARAAFPGLIHLK